MSLRYGQFCPIAKAAEILGERWTILIVRELLLGTTRFNDLQRGLSGISPTLLTKRLGQLEACGLVARRVLSAPRRNEYHLAPAGRELRPIVLGLGKWGMRWARGQMSADELDIEMLMLDLNRRLDATQLPGCRTVVQFVFSDASRFSRWWIVVQHDGTRELCLDNPRQRPDVQLRCAVRTLTEIWAGDTTIEAARARGALHVSGDPVLVRTVSRWLRPGLLSHVRPRRNALRPAKP